MKQNLFLRVKLLVVFAFIMLGSYTSLYACDSLVVKGTLSASGSPNGVVLEVYEIVDGTPDLIATGAANSSGWYYIDLTQVLTSTDNICYIKAYCCNTGAGIDKYSQQFNFGLNCRKTINFSCAGECNP